MKNVWLFFAGLSGILTALELFSGTFELHHFFIPFWFYGLALMCCLIDYMSE